MFKGKLPALPEPTGEVLKLFNSACEKYFAGDLASAADDFAAVAVAPNHNAQALSLGWSQYCRAAHYLMHEGNRLKAHPLFQIAHKQLTESGDKLGATRAEVGLLICQGQEYAANNDYEESVDEYVKAKGTLEFLKPRLPKEQAIIQRVSLGLDFDIAFTNLMDDATDEDFDGARSELAKLKEAHVAYDKFLEDGDSKTFLKSTVLFAEGLCPFIQGAKDANRHSYEDAIRRFELAMPHLRAACEQAKFVEEKKKHWKEHTRLLQAILFQCQAGIARAKGMTKLTENRPFECLPLLREAAGLLDQASASCAEAGYHGISGLYSSAEARDTLTGLVNAVERTIEKELLTIPDFSKLALDTKLAAVLNRDYREVLQAFLAGAWKLCMTGAGSIIEAMLIDRLLSKWPDVLKACKLDPKTPTTKIEDWRLWDLIQNAEKADILTPGNKYLSDALRDYRNLIHPLKDALGKYDIGRNEALGSLRALLSVIGSLK